MLSAAEASLGERLPSGTRLGQWSRRSRLLSLLKRQEGTGNEDHAASIQVDNHAKALAFYTEVLGFVKKEDFPVGQFKWLTVVSPEAPDGVELVLEPNDNPAAQAYQQALHEQGIPCHVFGIDDTQAEYERLKELGVVFSMEPVEAGPAIQAMFDDTCGNRILIYQVL